MPAPIAVQDILFKKNAGTLFDAIIRECAYPVRSIFEIVTTKFLFCEKKYLSDEENIHANAIRVLFAHSDTIF
ncbi:MAG: hypothetical protein C4527_04735 [Candidatus Omnitrophota bacterium]|nr:MAG: hypothetical protein C4527_04735 [Candidatus Omnitrophota bacterium]